MSKVEGMHTFARLLLRLKHVVIFATVITTDLSEDNQWVFSDNSN